MDGKSLILYHGTDSKILNPDLTKCNAYRDFGRAFYLSYNKGLARDWAEKKSRTQPKVNGYGLILNNVEDGFLKIKRFSADEKWAKFVYDNRTREGYVRPDYDIVIGPIGPILLYKESNCYFLSEAIFSAAIRFAFSRIS